MGFNPACASSLKDKTFDNPSLFTVGGGAFAITKQRDAGMLQFEYRSTLHNFKKARPILGLFVTQKGTTYVYGGIGYDIFFGKHIVFMPSLCPGIYFAAKGKKLHYPLEFRSAAELAYVFKNKCRIGGQFYHISNASLASRNPGVEAVLLNFSIPL